MNELSASCSVLESTYLFASAGINPTEPIANTFAFFKLVAELSIVLVNIEGEKARIDRRVCVKSLKHTN